MFHIEYELMKTYFIFPIELINFINWVKIVFVMCIKHKEAMFFNREDYI